MPWVKFTGDFDFSPRALGGRRTTSYRSGMVENVTVECAGDAVAAGKAVPMRRLRKADKPQEITDGDADRRR